MFFFLGNLRLEREISSCGNINGMDDRIFDSRALELCLRTDIKLHSILTEISWRKDNDRSGASKVERTRWIYQIFIQIEFELYHENLISWSNWKFVNIHLGWVHLKRNESFLRIFSAMGHTKYLPSDTWVH